MDNIKSEVRFLQELGPNLIKITKRLLANQNLLKLLYYTDKDPLSTDKEKISPEEAYKHGDDGIIRIVPIIGYKEDSTSVISLRILKGVPSVKNSDFLDIYFSLEIVVPNNQWAIKGDNLRPYMIMGEIQKTLENKTINGLGTIRGSGFATNYITSEITCYIMNYKITQYN